MSAANCLLDFACITLSINLPFQQSTGDAWPHHKQGFPPVLPLPQVSQVNTEGSNTAKGVAFTTSAQTGTAVRVL